MRITCSRRPIPTSSGASGSLLEELKRLAVARLLHEVPQPRRKLRLQSLEGHVKRFGYFTQRTEMSLGVAITEGVVSDEVDSLLKKRGESLLLLQCVSRFHGRRHDTSEREARHDTSCAGKILAGTVL
jgi:hypothetical protein